MGFYRGKDLQGQKFAEAKLYHFSFKKPSQVIAWLGCSRSKGGELRLLREKMLVPKALFPYTSFMAELKAYDLYAKAILKDPKNLKDFLQEFLQKDLLPHLDLSQLSLVPEEQISLPKEKRLLLNIIAQVPLLGKPLQLYILLEHKSYQDLSAYAQILNYISALFEKALKEDSKPIPVLPFIFYHGEKPRLYPVEFVEL